MIAMIVEIPNDVKVEVRGNEVIVEGSLGSNIRKFNDALLSVSIKGNELTVSHSENKKISKKAENAEGSFASEIRGDIDGVKKYFEKNMSIVFAHFPMTVEVNGNDIIIKNIIGERAYRKSKIVGNTKIDVKGQNVRVYGINKEDVSQTSANLRKACKIRKKDERIFQDGVYNVLEEA